MNRTFSAPHQKQSGFTIVELAVVIVVIGILVSIGYFGYNAWRDRVAETEIKSDLSGVASAMESARNWSDGYPVLVAGVEFDGNSDTSSLFKQSEHVTLTYFGGDKNGFCVDAVSTARPSITMFLDTRGGVDGEAKSGTCTHD